MVAILCEISDVAKWRRLAPDMPPAVYSPYAYTVQQTYLWGDLGSLYPLLIAAVEAAPATPLPARFTAILPYIKDYLSNRVLQDMAADHGFIYDSWGIVNKTTDASTALSPEDRGKLVAKFRSQAEQQRAHLFHFINDNQSTYPEASTCEWWIGTNRTSATVVLNPFRPQFN
jgi:hypothetical protein